MIYSHFLLRPKGPGYRLINLYSPHKWHNSYKSFQTNSISYYYSPSSHISRQSFSTLVDPEKEEKRVVKEVEKKLTIWQKVKHEIVHYYNGFKLLGIEIKIAIGICFQILRGKSLTRRERNQLVRTTADIFRLIPFSVFVIVPFMEFLLPLYIKFFPFMMPSTFKEQKKEEVAIKQKFLGKLEMAKFLQETLNKNISAKEPSESDMSFKDFTNFLKDVRESGKMPDIRDIIRFSRIFEDNITLESLDNSTLTALCKLLDLPAIGTKDMLLFQLNLRVRQLKAQDQMIKEEGIEDIPAFELQSLCRERGMRSAGLTEERLRQQLQQWLILHLDQKVPVSLLLLSRAMYVQDHTLPPAKQLQMAICKITESGTSEATLAIEGIDPKSKIEALKKEQEIIKEERLAKKSVAPKEVLVEAKPVIESTEPLLNEKLVDRADVITQSTGIAGQATSEKVETKEKSDEFLTKEDLSDITEALHIIKDEHKAIEFDATMHEMKDDLEEACKTQLKIKGEDNIDQEVLSRIENLDNAKTTIREEGILEKTTQKESAEGPAKKINKSNKALTDRVDKLLVEVNKMMGQLESTKESVKASIDMQRMEVEQSGDPNKLKEKIQTDEKKLVDLDQVMRVLSKINSAEKNEKMERLLAVLDEDKDGKIETDHILSLIEMLQESDSDMKISEKELVKIIDMIDTEKELDQMKTEKK